MNSRKAKFLPEGQKRKKRSLLHSSGNQDYTLISNPKLSILKTQGNKHI